MREEEEEEKEEEERRGFASWGPWPDLDPRPSSLSPASSRGKCSIITLSRLVLPSGLARFGARQFWRATLVFSEQLYRAVTYRTIVHHVLERRARGRRGSSSTLLKRKEKRKKEKKENHRYWSMKWKFFFLMRCDGDRHFFFYFFPLSTFLLVFLPLSSSRRRYS